MKNWGYLAAMALAVSILFSVEHASGLTGFGGIDTHIHLYAPPGITKASAPVGASGSFRKPDSKQKTTGSASASVEFRRIPDSSGEEMYIRAAKNLLELMNKRNVARAMVMPPPQYQRQAGAYDYKILLPAIEASGGRLFLVAGGGSLNPLIVNTPPNKVTLLRKKAFEKKANEIIKAGAVAFGEMTALHVCMNQRHQYMEAPPDHPLFLLLADIAAKRGIPIDLHMEAVLEKMSTPERLLEACSKNPRTLPPTIPGLERLLKHNINAKIVWQHTGWDNTGQMTPELLDRLLHDHPNLFLSIRVLSLQQNRLEGFKRNTITDPRGRLRPEWEKLFMDHPDRFMVGSDVFVGEPDSKREQPESFHESWRAINNLLEPARSKVSWKTAAEVYKVDKR